MRKLLYIFLLLIITLTACTQENKKIKLFEQKLVSFRFSLNKELEKMSQDKIIEFKFDSKDTVVLLVNKFYDEHKKEILNYRKYLLKKYSKDLHIDLKMFIKVDIDTKLLISACL